MDSGRSIEVTGEDVEQAIAKGLAELNAGPGDVIVEVLEEPARGMFGIGARPARVRLQMLVAPSPAAQEKPIARPVPTVEITDDDEDGDDSALDRKSTRLNSSHVKISYAVFCLKKNKQS